MNENTRIKTLAAATAHAWDAFVIVVGMLKGGTGKTTSAWFIALYYAVVLGLPTLFAGRRRDQSVRLGLVQGRPG
ncbi:hypothetical protein [Streptomyces sp. NPDC093591]|uniref:hypothetical protein n=1 Tax=Streptomyces sp. NPDC093591 TaxID=3366044 RepID=UPI00380AB36C